MRTTLAITPLKHTVYIPYTMPNTAKTLPQVDRNIHRKVYFMFY